MTTYSLEHCPTVEKFLDDDHRHRLLMGPIGSGKSVGCIMDITQRAARQKPNEDGIRKTRWAVVRNTYKQLEDTTVKSWLDWFPSPTWGRFKIADNNYDMRWVLEDGTIVEAEIRFRALDRPDQIVNLLSAEYTGAWFNEARHINLEIWDGMDGRIGRYPAAKDGGCSWKGILLDTNPPDEEHWIYKLFEEQRPDNAKAFYQPSGLSDKAENIPNLPEDYYTEIIKTKDEYYVHVYVHGNYGYLRDGKPIYPEYNDNVHCDPQMMAVPGLPLYIGLDFGLTPAAVICQLTVNGRLIVIDEVTSTRSGIKQFLDVLRPYILQTYPDHDIEEWYCDPAGAQKGQADFVSPYDIMMQEGIFPVSGDQNLDVRIESVKNLLSRLVDGKPALQISHRCKMLRKGFSGHYRYRRMMTSAERYADKPDKNEASHIHDALQYLCTRLFGVFGSMKDVKPPRVNGISARGY